VITVPEKNRLPGRVVARLSSDTFWMAVFLVVMVGQLSQWVPGFRAIPLVKISFALAVIAALRAGKLRNAVRVLSLRGARPAIAFLLLAIVSILFSIYKSETLTDIQSAAIYLTALVLLVKIAQSPRDLERLLFGLAVAGVLLAVGTLANFAGGRAAISGWDSNDIAYSLVTLLPIVLVQRQDRSRVTGALVGAAALLMVVAILLTGSRGGVVGLVVSVAAMVAFPLGLSRKGQIKSLSLGATLLRLVPIVVAASVLWAHLPTATTERIATLEHLNEDYNLSENIEESRILVWRRDIGFAMRRPLGYGMGTAPAVDGLFGRGHYMTAHNSLVQVLVELGVLGLILYLTAYYRAWRGLAAVTAAHRKVPAPENVRLALHARALGIALAGNFAAGFFLSQGYSGLLWMLIAVCAVLVRLGNPGYGVIINTRASRPPVGAEIAAK
jgi:O-antigen ligase